MSQVLVSIATRLLVYTKHESFIYCRRNDLNMQRTPQEIMEKIVSQLTITDAAAVENAASKPLLGRRSDPMLYLQNHFKMPVYLLATMADSGAIIGGARALEYFAPCHTNRQQVWDFYVPPNSESVADMMYALQDCGVQWHVKASCLSCVSDWEPGVVKSMSAESVYTLAQVVSFTQRGNPTVEPPVSAVVARSIYARLQALRADDEHMEQFTCDITKGEDDCEFNESTICHGYNEMLHMKVSHWDSKTGYTLSIYVLSSRNTGLPQTHDAGDCSIMGTLFTPRGTMEVVNMTICTTQDDLRFPQGVLSSMSGYGMSHLRCFISGWSAVRLCPSHSESQTSEVSYIAPAEINVVKAYKKDGYTFHWQDSNPTVPASRVSVHTGNVEVVRFDKYYSQRVYSHTGVRNLMSCKVDMLTEMLKLVSWYCVYTGDPDYASVISFDASRELHGLYTGHMRTRVRSIMKADLDGDINGGVKRNIDNVHEHLLSFRWYIENAMESSTPVTPFAWGKPDDEYKHTDVLRMYSGWCPTLTRGSDFRHVL